MNNSRRGSSVWKPAVLGLGLFFVVIVAALLYWWHLNPLTKDAEMIAHFEKHRKDIVELVERYRQWKPSKEIPNWGVLPENVALMKQAGVKRVKAINPYWYPDPYTVEGAKKFREANTGFDNRYRSISVQLTDPRRPQRDFASVFLRTGPELIFKGLVYFPQKAKTTEGKIYWPVDANGWSRPPSGLVNSLDEYPSDWKRGECVYRQLEIHWYIYMCMATV